MNETRNRWGRAHGGRLLALFAMFAVLGRDAHGQSPTASGGTTSGGTTSSGTGAREAKQQGQTARSSDSQAPGNSPPADDAPGRADRLREQTLRIEQLIEGRLSASVDVSELFEIDLDDPVAVVRRRQHLARQIGGCSQCEQGAGSASGPNAAHAMGGAASLTDEPARGDPAAVEFWQERLLLARSSFLSLPAARRDAILSSHGLARQAIADKGNELSDAATKAADAELARQQALQAARLARTEAERLLQEELARLLAVEKAQAEYESKLVLQRRALKQRAEDILRMQRKVREALDAEESRATELYTKLIAQLERSRRELHAALGAKAPPPPLPSAEDPLAELDVEFDTSAVSARRERLFEQGLAFAQRREALSERKKDQLFGEARSLNEDRLELLQALPKDERAAVTGFGLPGVRHAALELEQVGLTARYHLDQALQFMKNLARGQLSSGPSAFTTGATAVQILVTLLLFWWVRRQVPKFIELSKRKVIDEDLRQGRTSHALRSLGILERVYRPALLLLGLWTVHWVLPGQAKDQLEVELLFSTLFWLTGAALAIQAIDAVAATSHLSRLDADSGLRLRSLRLIGRTVAGIGLVLSLSQHLVGQGTIFSWVTTFTWALVLPFFLLLSHWWRPVVHARLEGQRRLRPFQAWLLKRRTGLVGVVASGLAGLQLLWLGAFRVVRKRTDEFVVTRRVLAYLFQRQLDKRAETDERRTSLPLDERVFQELTPRATDSLFLSSANHATVSRFVERLGTRPRGLHAIVGERGAGKTSSLQHIDRSVDDSMQLKVQSAHLNDFRATLLEALGGSAASSLQDAARLADERADLSIICIDATERLIQPVIGGLSVFDELLAAVRTCSHNVAWILSFDEFIWNFFEGARGAKPTFDSVIRLKPWSESEIRQLLESRTRQAGIDPSFERLVSELPADADEEERSEAHEAAATNYYRLIWDYSDGNPSVALHTWRNSLVQTGQGEVMVQLFQPPRTNELEELPDSVAFVLRAVVQLGRATEDQVATVTKLPRRQILDALRYCLVRDYLESSSAGVTVSWLWFRPITRYLERRHLLTNRSNRRGT